MFLYEIFTIQFILPLKPTTQWQTMPLKQLCQLIEPLTCWVLHSRYVTVEPGKGGVADLNQVKSLGETHEKRLWRGVNTDSEG